MMNFGFAKLSPAQHPSTPESVFRPAVEGGFGNHIILNIYWHRFSIVLDHVFSFTANKFSNQTIQPNLFPFLLSPA